MVVVAVVVVIFWVNPFHASAVVLSKLLVAYNWTPILVAPPLPPLPSLLGGGGDDVTGEFAVLVLVIVLVLDVPVDVVVGNGGVLTNASTLSVIAKTSMAIAATATREIFPVVFMLVGGFGWLVGWFLCLVLHLMLACLLRQGSQSTSKEGRRK